MLHKLCLEIRRAVESYCDDPDLCEGMLQALSRPGCALHPEARCTGGLLTLKVYEAICGIPATAVFQAAVAMEFYIYAAYMFDNVADHEADSIYGTSPAEELPIAIGLMTCGGRAACEAGKQAGSNAKSLNLLFQLQKNCLSSCSGQLMDARLQKRGEASIEESLEMTQRKSGSLGRLAAALGAIMATDDPKIIDLFEDFGFNIYTYIQLIDDLRDACPADSQLSDLEQRKQTVPLVYFYNFLLREHMEQGCDIIPSLYDYDELSRLDICRGFSASGADIFAAIVAETFLNRARNNLAALKHRVRTVEGLEQFVSSLEISPDEVFAAV